MTKGTPYALYLADSTKEALTRPVDDLVYIDEMPVRGRTQPIKLWSLTSPAVLKTDWESEVAKPDTVRRLRTGHSVELDARGAGRALGAAVRRGSGR